MYCLGCRSQDQSNTSLLGNTCSHVIIQFRVAKLYGSGRVHSYFDCK
jgi:hypothetical protein